LKIPNGTPRPTSPVVPDNVTSIDHERKIRRRKPLRSDAAEISPEARELKLAARAVSDASEVREDVVHRTKMRLRNDALRIDPEKIAERLSPE
jgi:anti-sigma28 factor (negative regulator of flagellin synthesis)